MKIFETPELKISRFHRANILTTSAEGITAVSAAEKALTEKYTGITQDKVLTWDKMGN